MMRCKAVVSSDIFLINKQYDRLRDNLMADYEVWELSKSVYTYDKFKDYHKTLATLRGKEKKEFRQRFIREMKRAIELDELDITSFEDRDKEKLAKLLFNNDSNKKKLLKKIRLIYGKIKVKYNGSK